MQDTQASAQWQVTCQCGWRVKGSKEVVVEAVQEHGRTAHNVELTEEQVMAQAVPGEGPQA
jgi:predicted small metal-binding protein